MPSTDEIQAALAVTAHRVVGVDADRVVPGARLREDLGIDSLSILEVCEALALHFDVHLSDPVINEVATVDDVVRGISSANSRPAGAATASPTSDRSHTVHVANVSFAKSKATRWAAGMAVIGVVIGAVMAVAVISLVRASGINAVSPPPVSTSSYAASPSASSSSSSSPSPTETTSTPKKKPTLKAKPEQVAPGERIKLTGKFPKLDEGTTLQVEAKGPDEDWHDFPVTAVTQDGGKFTTTIKTQREGKRKIRMTDPDGDAESPTVEVTVE